MPEGERPAPGAPPGSCCGEHPERSALATCARCGSYACLECWVPHLERCQACIQRDPASAAPPVPWETDGGLGRRLADTLATAVRPVRTAPSFAHASPRAALGFALWVSLPLALVRGIIPFTHTIFFEPPFQARLTASYSVAEVMMDVVRAAGISLLVTVVLLLALALPYVSLCRAYGSDRAASAAICLILYRSWIVAAFSMGPLVPGVLFELAIWSVPASATGAISFLFLIDLALPLAILLTGMRAGARLAGGVGTWASFAVVLIPLTLLFLAQGFTLTLIEPWLPDVPPPS